MPSSFITLTNELLVAFNEVPLTEGDFLSARNIQARAKSAIRYAVAEINQHTKEWPFNAVQKAITLVPGQEEYSWPDDFQTVEWDSFFITKDVALNINTTRLRFGNRDEWYERARSRDDDSLLVGINVPQTVFPSHGTGFGVSPSPNAAYPLTYRYFKTPAELTLASDLVTIPTQYNHVILSGAGFHMQMFRDNSESSQITKNDFKELISSMRINLLGQSDTMRDGRVRY